MADHRTPALSLSELSERYHNAVRRFSEVTAWRDYLALAEEFRLLDTYEESPAYRARCIRAASDPAYREVTEHLAATESPTMEDYRRAATIMQTISDHRDARELARVYTIKANILAYEEAVALLTRADATTEELGRGVSLLQSIRTFRNARDLLDRFQKHYFERVYAEAMRLEECGCVYSEFEEAAALFEKIPTYSDAAAHAAACRKKAAKLRPRRKKTHPPATADAGEGDRRGPTPSDETTTRPRRHREDETHSLLSEVWQTMDKRRMGWFILWVLLFVATLYASVVLPGSDHPFFQKYSDETRGILTIVAVVTMVMSVRSFLRMLTASMRKKLREATLKTLKRMAAPFVAMVGNLLRSIGIDPSRRSRLGGQDERSFVFVEEERPQKTKKRLKNDLKWHEQTDNALRVRFIYIEYMIRRIKDGYRLKTHLTPAEIGAELAVEEAETSLFDAYDKARYAGPAGAEEISDETVRELLRIKTP